MEAEFSLKIWRSCIHEYALTCLIIVCVLLFWSIAGSSALLLRIQKHPFMNSVILLQLKKVDLIHLQLVKLLYYYAWGKLIFLTKKKLYCDSNWCTCFSHLYSKILLDEIAFNFESYCLPESGPQLQSSTDPWNYEAAK